MTGTGQRLRRTVPWTLLAIAVLAQIGYPLTGGSARARLVVLTVGLGFALSVWHAAATRGGRTAAVLVAVTAGGGFAVEALGVATGVPFGGYAYSADLGPRLLGVPLVIPLAWTWMAWPAWLAASRLTTSRLTTSRRTTSRRTTSRRTARAAARVGLAAVGLAGWDLFLDPQMVAEGYWRWADPHPALPGVPGIPVGNYLGWLVVALAMMALLAGARIDRPAAPTDDHPAAPTDDRPMYTLYLWTYSSSIMAHAVLLDLPAAAAWGGLGMGVVAVPLAVTLLRGPAPATPPPRRSAR